MAGEGRFCDSFSAPFHVQIGATTDAGVKCPDALSTCVVAFTGMLPSEKIELAIYQRIKPLGPGAVTMSIPMLHQSIAEDHATIVERLKSLEAENRISLFKYSGVVRCPRSAFAGDDASFFYTGSFLIEVAPQGRRYFEELEHRAHEEAVAPSNPARGSTTASGPLVFVSCGQSTLEERRLGKKIADLVERETGCEAYFAENQQNLEGVTENILKKLHDALGFIAIMHPRGDVANPRNPTESPWVRGSVWIEQEIAISAFISQALQRPIRVLLYVHESIRREGLRDKLHLNPVSFRDDAEILQDLTESIPSWKSLALQERKQPLSLTANIRHRRVPIPGGGTDDERHQLLVNVENDGEQDATDFKLDLDFPAAFLDESGNVLQVPSSEPGFVRYEITNAVRGIAHLYAGEKTGDLITFHYAILGKMKREHPEQLEQKVTATVYSGDMKPRKTVRTIAELMG